MVTDPGSATQIADAVQSGKLQVLAAVDDALTRADAAAHLNAFTQLRPEDAAERAEAVQRRADAGETLPLAGVPFAIKDVTDLKGWPTGHGVARKTIAVSTHPAVQRLLVAGAVPIGKTTTSELALWPQTATPAIGSTRNPHDGGRTPGGSSGGSAAAVAAGVVPFATATDGGGSIRIPAAHCGVLGLKDARGRVPGPEHWRGLTTLGAHVRSWPDLLLVQAVLVDALTRPPIAASGRPRRFARLTALGEAAEPAVERAVDQTCDALAAAGHVVEEVRADRRLRQAARAFSVLFAAGARDDVRRLQRPTTAVATRRFLRLARAAPPLAPWAHRAAAAAAFELQARFAPYDALVMPTTPSLAPELKAPWERGLPDLLSSAAASSSWTSPFNALGWAAISVPVRSDSGLPAGVQFVSPTQDGMTLARIVGDLQLQSWIPPTVPATA